MSYSFASYSGTWPAPVGSAMATLDTKGNWNAYSDGGVYGGYYLRLDRAPYYFYIFYTTVGSNDTVGQLQFRIDGPYGTGTTIAAGIAYPTGDASSPNPGLSVEGYGNTLTNSVFLGQNIWSSNFGVGRYTENNGDKSFWMVDRITPYDATETDELYVFAASSYSTSTSIVTQHAVDNNVVKLIRLNSSGYTVEDVECLSVLPLVQDIGTRLEGITGGHKRVLFPVVVSSLTSGSLIGEFENVCWGHENFTESPQAGLNTSTSWSSNLINCTYIYDGPYAYKPTTLRGTPDRAGITPFGNCDSYSDSYGRSNAYYAAGPTVLVRV